MDIELLVNMDKMLFYGVFSDGELARDVLVSLSPNDQYDDF